MIIDRRIAPPVKEINSFNIVKADQDKLSNGIPMYRLNTGTSEMVKVEFLFSAGNWYQELPVIAFAVNHMLIEGSKKYTSSQIAENIDFYGASTGYNVDKDNAFISVMCMKKHLPNVLEIVEDIIKNATFPEQELNLFLKKHKQQFLVEHTKVRNIARSVHARMLFGNQHPYGYMIEEGDFDKLDYHSLIQFYQQRYQSRHCKIVISGKADDHVAKLVEKSFGSDSWNYQGLAANPTFDLYPDSERIISIERPDAVQNAIRIGKMLFTKLHPDFVGFSVLNCILGGYFGSRLMRKIREEKGYTYGINSLLVELKNAGYLTIMSELGSEVTSDALADIYVEIDKLRKEPVPLDELTRVKNYMLGEILRMFDGPFAQAESLISLLEMDLGYDYFDQMAHTIKTITTDEIQSLANKYLDPESFYQVIVGRK
jgi:zinc protease